MEQQNIPSNQTISSSIPASNYNRNIIIIGVILLLLVGTVSYFLGAKSQQKKQSALVLATPIPTTIVSPTIEPTQMQVTPTITALTLKHYSHTNPDIAFDYPTTWFGASNGDRNTSVNGPEGGVGIFWGGGFGGGPCPSKHVIIQTKAGTLDMCDTITNGTEALSVSNDGHQTFKGAEGSNFMIQAHVNQPIENNRVIVIKVLESLQ